jgi:ATP-binding cassette subfamily C (CFTR/MRP) protein 1
MRDGVYDDAAAVTHMSSDAANIEEFPSLFQEVWATSVEFLLGMAMLWGQLGWWSLTPLILLLRKCRSNLLKQQVERC